MSAGLLLTPSPGDLLWGSTALLGFGAAAATLARAPAHAQRAAELAVAGTLIWLVLALVPLPRWPARSAEVQPAVSIEVASTGIAVRGPAGAPGSARPDRVTRSAPEESSSVAGPGQVRSPRSPDGGDARGLSTGRLLWITYGIGSAIATAYLLLGAMLVYRLRSRSTRAPSWLEALFTARSGVMGVRRACLRVSHSRCRPLLIGFFVPTVIIPLVLADPKRNADLCRALDHELIHVRRKDVWSRFFFAFAAVMLWPHPLFWYIRVRAALSAELIADDAASTADRRTYARALLALADEFSARRFLSGIVPGAFRNRSELTRRIEMLTRNHTRFAMKCEPKLRALQAGATLLLVGLCAAFFGARSLPAQESSSGGNRPQSEIAWSMSGPTQPALLQQYPDPGYAATLALVDRVLTLQGEVELAQAELTEAERLRETGVMQASELTHIRLNMATLQRRLEAALILVQSEIEATRIELARIQEALESRIFRAGEGPPSSARARQVRLAAQLKVLQMVL